MFRHKIVGFVSKIDQYINAFDRTHTQSEAQIAEVDKYANIDERRDNPDYVDSDTII